MAGLDFPSESMDGAIKKALDEKHERELQARAPAGMIAYEAESLIPGYPPVIHFFPQEDFDRIVKERVDSDAASRTAAQRQHDTLLGPVAREWLRVRQGR
jgi:hypothetical protein